MGRWQRLKRLAGAGLGCGYIIRIGFLLVTLLLINGLLVMILLKNNEGLSADLRIKQTLQFVLPVGLIFVEFWLFDFFRQLSRR